MSLSPDEARSVEAAFDAAQARTRAPMIGVLAAASSDYAVAPLLFGGLVALATPWPLILLTRISAERIFTAQLGVCLIVAAAFSLAPLRILLTPRRAQRAVAHRAALAQYAVRGLDRAAERNGVLIYVSLAERYARVIADQGASRVVGAAQWQTLVDALVADIGGLGPARAMSNAAARCADLLAPHFPAEPGAAPPGLHRFHLA